jgi:hypothetical protein
LGTRGRACIVAGIVVAALASGCGRSGKGPTDSAPGWPSGAVRRGQTGKVPVIVASQPYGFPGEIPGPAIPSFVLLNPDAGGDRLYKFFEIPLAPIVVTENPTDEEFWELQSALPPGAIGDHAGTTVRDDGVRVAHQFIFGARPKCEELRDTAHRNGVTTSPCLGPHYLKRTGPPEEIAPRRGYNPPGYNAR